MLLEEYVDDRVRASERAAHIQELELLRVIRADAETRPAAGWLKRRRAAKAQKREAVADRATTAREREREQEQEAVAVSSAATVVAATRDAHELHEDAAAPSADALPGVERRLQHATPSAQDLPEAERELQHAGR